MGRDQEALKNVIKGALFEYLVGSYLSNKYSSSISSLSESVTPQDRMTLIEYERLARTHAPVLLNEVSQLASIYGEEISKKFNGISKVQLTGSGRQFKDEKIQEADLIISDERGDHGISLKLTTSSQGVNTKSAGIKTFLLDYFQPFHPIREQSDLLILLQQEFASLSYYFESFSELTPGDHFVNWRKEKLSELPGDLPAELKIIYQKYLSVISNKVADVFHAFNLRDSETFKNCLYPLAGFSNENIIQVNCLHQLDCPRISFLNRKDLGHFSKFKIVNESDQASFKIVWDLGSLSVRVKSMNKFTVPALKVNCFLKLNS